MGFFKSAKSHLDAVESGCTTASTLATKLRSLCELSLRGKYEYMPAEQRADLLKEAMGVQARLLAALEGARAAKKAMDSDSCPSEDLLAAESRVLAASLDSTKCGELLREAHGSLREGMSEIEQFYGPKSSEARHIRKVLEELPAAP